MNKIYMKIVFSLLTLFAYVSNKALGSESISSEIKLSNSLKHNVVYDQYEIYEQNKHLACTNLEEQLQANEIMHQALNKFYEYFMYECNYKLYAKYNKDTSSHFHKYTNNPDVGKLDITIHHPHMYDEIVNILWDPNGEKKYNPDFIGGKVFRTYNPNLLLIQQRYKNGFMGRQDYFYALALKHKPSKDTTIIVMSSVNVNDHNRKDGKKYENAIVNSANSFETNIDSEEDIKNGKLNKMFVHLSGYSITKYIDHVEIIHIDSIDGDIPSKLPHWYKLSNKSERLTRLIELSNYIDRKVYNTQ
ncbi:fam-a protein [Plasmodium chabaudi chabaudi]|uniref:Fam-a protein n=1 Tax=Plasmodium chabaudi chabaudi TaxID=31271 RepID=A0A4V0K7D9_PLACU|nr:fam-a protein [Plasmodium chabaudi chabaudi]VTZ68987.1 fam-a protein [Plasmodium chabaudi chabaudi]|eukprot:XP_016655459.1 fam-a protein [Plasmodium chabaudi chabaudi]